MYDGVNKCPTDFFSPLTVHVPFLFSMFSCRQLPIGQSIFHMTTMSKNALIHER